MVPVPRIIIRHHLNLLFKALVLTLFLIIVEISSHCWVARSVVVVISYILIDEYLGSNYFALRILNKIVSVTSGCLKIFKEDRRGHLRSRPNPSLAAWRSTQRAAPRQATRRPRTRGSHPSPQPTRTPAPTTHTTPPLSGHESLSNIVKHQQGDYYHFCTCAGCVIFSETHCAREKCSFCTITYHLD